MLCEVSYSPPQVPTPQYHHPQGAFRRGGSPTRAKYSTRRLLAWLVSEHRAGNTSFTAAIQWINAGLTTGNHPTGVPDLFAFSTVPRQPSATGATLGILKTKTRRLYVPPVHVRICMCCICAHIQVTSNLGRALAMPWPRRYIRGIQYVARYLRTHPWPSHAERDAGEWKGGKGRTN